MIRLSSYFILVAVLVSGFGYYYIHSGEKDVVIVEKTATKQIETENVDLIEKNLTTEELKVFENEDISDLAEKEYVSVDVVTVTESDTINQLMLDILPHKELNLYNVNTQEKIETVYSVAGQYVPEALDKLDKFMRDWRRNQVIDIDPELYDLLHELHAEGGWQISYSLNFWSP